MSANETQVGGEHYASDYQHWDFVQDCLGGRYIEGQITKYVYRWRHKNGLQDLEKALHFALKLEELVLANVVDAQTRPIFSSNNTGSVGRFCVDNNLSTLERQIMFLCAGWRELEDLELLQRHIRALMQET